MFDYQQLVRWQIPLSDLPEGSLVINTPDSFYATPSAFYNLYKQYIWVGIIFIAAQMFIIVFLAINIVRRRNAEDALKQYSEHLEEMVDDRTQELREAQEQLVQQERLATLGQLAGSVAHELHNPLGAIKNTTYFLDMALENPDDDIKESLKILNQEVMTSEHIISSLLEFSHPEPAIRHEVDINEFLQQVIAEITLPDNIEVVTHLDTSLPPTQADPQQLEVIFDNLIRNAIQAMSLAKNEPGQLNIESNKSDDNWLTVSIKDTGVGISPENLPRLFEPLFTTKAKGIGLGLALAKLLTEENGGIIKVQSSGVPGQGSVFMVQLPLTTKAK
jgi:signal transduction histidine kinase